MARSLRCHRGLVTSRRLTGTWRPRSNSDGTYKYAISNIRGDIVASADTTGVSQAVAIDEFGTPASSLPSDRRYGFMGDKQRESLTSGGTVAMGVRLYVPGNGRFLQVDPVQGGSANAYDYANQDPINSTDLDGRKAKKKCYHMNDSFGSTGATVTVTGHWCTRGGKIITKGADKPRVTVTFGTHNGGGIFLQVQQINPPDYWYNTNHDPLQLFAQWSLRRSRSGQGRVRDSLRYVSACDSHLRTVTGP